MSSVEIQDNSIIPLGIKIEFLRVFQKTGEIDTDTALSAGIGKIYTDLLFADFRLMQEEKT